MLRASLNKTFPSFLPSFSGVCFPRPAADELGLADVFGAAVPVRAGLPPLRAGQCPPALREHVRAADSRPAAAEHGPRLHAAHQGVHALCLDFFFFFFFFKFIIFLLFFFLKFLLVFFLFFFQFFFFFFFISFFSCLDFKIIPFYWGFV